jgi:AmiR/NasT family two-component response regulator
MSAMKDGCGAIIVAQSITAYNTIKGVIASSFSPISQAVSLAQARQKLLRTDGCIIIINTPAADEFGIDGAVDIAVRTGTPVMALVSADIYERAVYRARGTGVFILSRPLKGQMLLESANLLLTMQRRIRDLQSENDRLSRRLEELGLVTRAKCILIEKRHMTEPEAHRFLETEAMNNSLTKKEVAQQIIRQYEE